LDGRIFALLSAACFGINSAVLKAGLGKGETHIAVVVGLLTGFPTILLLAPLYGGLHLNELSAPALLYFALSGASAVFMGRMLLYLGIERIGPARASTFKNAAPVFTAILAWFVLGEAVTGFRWLGILAVTLGLILIGNKARRGANPLTAAGLAIAMGSAFFYSLRPLLSKLGLNLAPLPLTSTLVQYMAALVLYLGFLLLTGQLGQARPDRRSLFFFAVGGVLQTLGVLFLQIALTDSDVTVVYPINASAPLITFVLSYTVLKNAERLTAWDLIGSLLAVTGVALLLTL
jgi:uncharacterized membrane protein